MSSWSLFPDCRFLHNQKLKQNFCVQFITFKIFGVELLYILILLPCLFFLFFLLAKLRLSVKILKKTESLLLHVVFTFVWAIVVLNLISALLTVIVAGTSQYITDSPVLTANGDVEEEKGRFKQIVIPLLAVIFQQEDLFATISLTFLNFITEFMEICVVMFVFHYGTTASAAGILTKTILISGIFSLADNLIAVLMMILFPQTQQTLITVSGETALYDILSNTVLCGIYIIIFLVPLFSKSSMCANSSCRKRSKILSALFPVRLNSKRTNFYAYLVFIILMNLLQIAGALLSLFCVPLGICLNALAKLLYFSCYAPVLYFCFLRSFFQKKFYDQFFSGSITSIEQQEDR